MKKIPIFGLLGLLLIGIIAAGAFAYPYGQGREKNDAMNQPTIQEPGE